MNKLIVQIPCYNEEANLGKVLAAIPRQIAGFEAVQILVIDDGSSDRTTEIASQYGVDHLLRLPRHQGLAKAFALGIEKSLEVGADVVVNIDADHQYLPEEIPSLVGPLLARTAEMVVGVRPINQMIHFSLAKKTLQKIGSAVVRLVSKVSIADATSGFRAYTREAASKLNVYSKYSYTLETLIQAGQEHMAVASVPVRFNPPTRPSRLLKNIPSYLYHSAVTIVRIFMTYRPFHFFAVPGLALFLAGSGIGVRFLYFFHFDGGKGHIQSLILASVLLVTGSFLFVTGLVAELIAVNRRLLEKIKVRTYYLH